MVKLNASWIQGYIDVLGNVRTHDNNDGISGITFSEERTGICFFSFLMPTRMTEG
jgi:hypothetical protein